MCTKCDGRSVVVCSTCNGFGSVASYAKWTLFEECIDDVAIINKQLPNMRHSGGAAVASSLPLKLLLDSKGTLLVDETNTSATSKLRPISTFPDDHNEVYLRSRELLRRHDVKLANSPDWKLFSQVGILITKLKSNFNKASNSICRSFLFSYLVPNQESAANCDTNRFVHRQIQKQNNQVFHSRSQPQYSRVHKQS